MLKTTRGIVLNYIKYAETSVIAKIFTEEFGMQTYIVNSVRTKKAKTKISLLQPLTLLEMEVYYRPQKDIQRAKEMKPYYIFTQLPFNIVKSALSLFVAELLTKVIREETENKELFDFLIQSIIQLDEDKKGLGSWHLNFLLNLSRYLGFFPYYDPKYQINSKLYFDLREGRFTDQIPTHPHFISSPNSNKIARLITAKKGNEVQLSREERKQLLRNLLNYFSLQVEAFKALRSLTVLEEVLA